MSRSGYNECGSEWELIRWRGAVASAIRGRRGQVLLRDLLAGLDALPEKRLIANELEADGCHCALGVVGKTRGIQMDSLDPENIERVAEVFDVAEAMSREIVFVNDEGAIGPETDAERFQRVRAWAQDQIITRT